MRSSGRLRRTTLVVLIAGFTLFALLSAGSRVLFDQAEDRLLQQRTNEALAVLNVSIGQIRAPLDTAAALASATGGDTGAFVEALEPAVGGDAQFTSVALFRVGDPTPVVALGAPMSLVADGSARAAAMMEQLSGESLVVIDLLGDPAGRRLGYAVGDSPTDPTYVVYGERTLSVDPTVRRRNDEPFSGLDYAIYLGTEPTTEHLLGASVRDLPIESRTASGVSPFGNSELLLVMTPIGDLSGELFASLWWITALTGLATTSTVAWLTQRILQRRDEAIALAADNARLFDEQRQIAETLQLSLLPQSLDVPPGAAVAARYWPAGSANLIGGDFYDVFRVDANRFGITIGDVCGKGIEAASLTGLARHTVRAASRRAERPSEVLDAVHVALRDHRPSTFCTACFAFVEQTTTGHMMTLSLGGHPHPVLRRADGSIEHIGKTGTLLGIVDTELHDVRLDLHRGDLLVLYTDGLTDAPNDQSVPMGEIEELLFTERSLTVEAMADRIRALKRRRRPHGSSDDTAVLVIQFGDLTRENDAHDVVVSSAGVAE